MDEFLKLWEVIKNQEKTFSSNLTFEKFQKSNESFDIYDEYSSYKNVNSWEELQTIIRCQYNRSFHLHAHQQRNIDQDCHPFGYMFEAIYSYYIPSMIFVGLLGNLLSCIVFLNTHLKMRSSSYYLAALACADFGFLAALFLVWLNGTMEVPVFNIEGYCQCIVYVSSVCSFLSVWLIAAFTVERFIAVQYPLHRPHMCTVARAKAIVLYLVCISLIVNTYVFVTSGIIKLDDGSEVCEMLERYREAMRVINIIDSVLTLIAPLLLIIVMNAMIIYNLIKFSKKFKKPHNKSEVLSRQKSATLMEIFASSNKCSSNNGSRKDTTQYAPTSSRNSFRRLSHFKFSTKPDDLDQKEDKCNTWPRVLVDWTSLTRSLYWFLFLARVSKCSIWLCLFSFLVALIGGAIISEINFDKKLISTRSQQNITKMLLLISSVFVLLNLPSYGIRLYVFIFFSIWAEAPPVLLWCMQQMFMVLYYTNFSINFLLYSMYGMTFRRCLWQLLRKKLKKISRY